MFDGILPDITVLFLASFHMAMTIAPNTNRPCYRHTQFVPKLPVVLFPTRQDEMFLLGSGHQQQKGPNPNTNSDTIERKTHTKKRKRSFPAFSFSRAFLFLIP